MSVVQATKSFVRSCRKWPLVVVALVLVFGSFHGCGSDVSKSPAGENNATANNSSNSNSSTNTGGECGNGEIDDGESCDGDCPTDCVDADACTRDVLSGSAMTCTAECESEPIVVCIDGDGCCASGCTASEDSDCDCEAVSCEDVQAECGTIDNGCGATIACPGTCSGDEVCDGSRCTEPQPLGSPCQSDSACGGFDSPICIETFADGYCSSECEDDAGCPTGTHCVALGRFGFDEGSVCMKDCDDDNDCRTSGYRCRFFDSDGGDPETECAPFASGTKTVGEPCVGVHECSQIDNLGGQQTVCVDRVRSGLSAIDFPEKVCTASCMSSGVCAGDAICVGNACAAPCNSNDQCRDGWECVESSFCWPQ